MKKVLSLVIVILMLMSSLTSCYISVGEVDTDNIDWEVERELSEDGESYIYTLHVSSQLTRRDIKGLVLGIHFYNEDNEHLAMTYVQVGDVDIGRGRKFQFKVKDLTLEEQETARVHVQVLAGSFVL